jgi:hypothetical protein
VEYQSPYVHLIAPQLVVGSISMLLVADNRPSSKSKMPFDWGGMWMMNFGAFGWLNLSFNG